LRRRKQGDERERARIERVADAVLWLARWLLGAVVFLWC
jgi:hypothetical protein